ncbi:SCP-like protein, partial [Ancylostoma caninum]
MFFSVRAILFLCVDSLIAAGENCVGGTLTPEVREQIVNFHKEKKRSLEWDCDLEREADSAFEKLVDGEVDTSKLKVLGRVSDYAHLSSGNITTDVDKALYYWSSRNDLESYSNIMNPENMKVGCAYKFFKPLGHLVCIY